ncbi:LysM peptidoglycan-binding domain-containing protein [Actinoplanes sp. NPDC026619]|uniref:LysM peptidoglycan-binding domain-containing protein n=1 Tax=Actinoplanes sp. NPDC026619 TaxID=3155798 RepID=UPI0033DC9964
MPRLGHGRSITEHDIQAATSSFAEVGVANAAAFALTRPAGSQSFDFLFPGLQDDEANLLPQAANTPELLKNLGSAMVDTDVAGDDSPIPAAYTYFGQFVDHDITLEVQKGFGSATMAQLLDPAMTPLNVAQIRNALLNERTPTLDLDSVYGLPAPHDPADGNKMQVGTVTPFVPPRPAPFARPPGTEGDDFLDLPREPADPGNIEHDRAAVIGDPRNDENLIVSQLHVAFLRAHNALVGQGLSFADAQRVLRQHYQHVVVHDFLKRIADPAIVDDIVANGNRWFDPLSEPSFMPLEFSVAGYRIGHTMVRAAYNFNSNFQLDSRPATLELLFTFTALSGELGGAATLPENWIIQWENIVGDDPAVMKTRRLDPSLAAFRNNEFGALFALKKVTGETETPDLAARLAVRNLLRGYRLRLPTGQAVAEHIGIQPLTKDEILAAAGSADQRLALEAGGFQFRTPLWYYVLAEAKHFHNGAHLGPVGSTLVAEVLIGLVRRSTDSILTQPGWTPSLPAAKPGSFELADLLRLAGVLPTTQTPVTYTVQAGDTLSSIAAARLGAANRWPQIYSLNQALIRDPDRIFPGQVFVLPPKQPVGDIPRLYTVQRGDTLSGIATAKLGNGGRWPEIFALNRAIITNPDRIIPGQVLVLPNS